MSWRCCTKTRIPGLQGGQVTGDFVIGYRGAVFLPLDLFVFDQAVEDVVAQGFVQEIAGFGQHDGFAQAGGQRPYAQRLPALGGHLQDVTHRRRGHLVFFLDPLEAGGKHDAEGEIGITGRIGSPVFNTNGTLSARMIGGNANEIGAVDVGP